MKYLFLPSVLTFIIFASSPIAGQLPILQRGIDLFEEGKYSESVKALELASRNKGFKNDASLWSYLGLAYLKNDEIKKARKPSEKAVKLQPQNAVYRTNLSYIYLMNRQIDKSQDQANRAIQIDPKQTFAYYLVGIGHLWEGDLVSADSYAEKILVIDVAYSQAYVLKSEILYATVGKKVSEGSTGGDELALLKRTVDVLETGLKNAADAASKKNLAEKLEGARAFYDYYAIERLARTNMPTEPEPGVTPLKVLSKPKASYTDNARQANAQGTVRLAVLLGSNSKVQHILKLKGIGYGLDEQAINAARQIKFEPKKKDGKPVSTVVIFEYGFNIY